MLWFLLLLRHAIAVLIVLASCLIFNVKTLIVYCYLCSILSSRNYRHSLVCMSVCLSVRPVNCFEITTNVRMSSVYPSAYRCFTCVFPCLIVCGRVFRWFCVSHKIMKSISMFCSELFKVLLLHQLKLLKNNVRIKVFNDVFPTCSTETFTEYCFL